ncbi:DUF418 domain-containing protein [Gynuella sunshinyii]|uniref:Putative membrane protein n=1 Tax=Gynuella sunshinyii YC6258 TaxID=1445510 RepID=A0A0C5VS96_9GAMM|nr:DUF418 domain-containing protein [Gynuella sunshinyii]AJQ96198.1 putative membrane protein [Gynuella sunshinyii YC6258]
MAISRTHEVDIIRMAALIGICVVNVPFMALPSQSVMALPEAGIDKLAAFVIEAFLQLKFFILFSFIFGWGVTVQQKSAQLKGYAFHHRYWRRMFGLLMFGILHATLVFSGDILVLYALAGMVLWFVRDASPKKLMIIAASMLPVSMVFMAGLGLVWIADPADPELMMTSHYSLGSGYLEGTLARLNDWPYTFVLLVMLQGPIVFAGFAAGLAAGKSNFFEPGSQSFTALQRRLPLLLAIGVPLNLFYAMAAGHVLPSGFDVFVLLSFMGVAIGAPALSAVYLYGLVYLGRRVSIPDIFVLAGRNSLSSYVLQGVFAGFLFAAYGMSWFDLFGQASLLGVALVLAISVMLLVGVYARIFSRGPLESVLRKISGG